MVPRISLHSLGGVSEGEAEIYLISSPVTHSSSIPETGE